MTTSASLLCPQSPAIALPAEWFVFSGLAQQYPFLILYSAMGESGQFAALHTNGMHLGHLVGNGAQGRHRAERTPPKIHIQPCHDDPHSIVCQLIAHIHQAVVKKLGLVYAHHVHLRGKQQNTGRRVYRGGRKGMAIVRHHIFLGITGVYSRFENLHPQAGKLGTPETAYQFLCLAGEHRAADDLYPPPAFRFLYMVFREYYHSLILILIQPQKYVFSFKRKHPSGKTNGNEDFCAQSYIFPVFISTFVPKRLTEP